MDHRVGVKMLAEGLVPGSGREDPGCNLDGRRTYGEELRGRHIAVD